MSEAVLCLGSNIGNTFENLNTAIDAIKRLPKTYVKEISKFYVTEPFEVPDKQENYLNCCVKIETALLPHTLLGSCLGIEAAMERVRTYKGAARIIDIDLILYDQIKEDTDDLILPHPRFFKRTFVLVPLNDLYPNKITPAFDFNIYFNEVVSGSSNKIYEYKN